MSQRQENRFELRAIFAVVAVCALVFSLFVSGAMRGARAEAFAFAEFSHAAPCPLMSGAEPAHHIALDHQKSGHSGKVDCPFCCLAAQAGAMVLPDRLGAVVRAPRVASSRVAYFAVATHSPKTAISNAVNAARAPPATLS